MTERSDSQTAALTIWAGVIGGGLATGVLVVHAITRVIERVEQVKENRRA